MDKKQIYVLCIKSLSYSGTTWVNTLIGSCEEAFSIGPPDRIWKISNNEKDNACLVHGKDCDFWPSFIDRRNKKNNFFMDLASISGKNVFVINNPSPDFFNNELTHPDIKVILIKQVRDGRANLISMLRHHPDRYESIYDAINQWLLPGINRLINYKHSNIISYLTVRYEDFISNPLDTLNHIGSFANIEYSSNSLEYWKYNHHLTAGNTGMIDVLRRFNNIDSFNHHRKEYYDALLEKTKLRPTTPINDNSWKRLLTANDLLVYKFLCGEVHHKLGYNAESYKISEADRIKLHELGIEFTHSNRPESFKHKDLRLSHIFINKNKQSAFTILYWKAKLHKIITKLNFERA